jgi:Nucleotidyl transferase AbiEii toxin, Type IV TA system
VLLNDLPAPRLRIYPRYTVIAEKFHAIASLGIANSRMKDFFDPWVLNPAFAVGCHYPAASHHGNIRTPRHGAADKHSGCPTSLPLTAPSRFSGAPSLAGRSS